MKCTKSYTLYGGGYVKKGTFDEQSDGNHRNPAGRERDEEE